MCGIWDEVDEGKEVGKAAKGGGSGRQRRTGGGGTGLVGVGWHS